MSKKLSLLAVAVALTACSDKPVAETSEQKPKPDVRAEAPQHVKGTGPFISLSDEDRQTANDYLRDYLKESSDARISFSSNGSYRQRAVDAKIAGRIRDISSFLIDLENEYITPKGTSRTNFVAQIDNYKVGRKLTRGLSFTCKAIAVRDDPIARTNPSRHSQFNCEHVSDQHLYDQDRPLKRKGMRQKKPSLGN